MPTHVTNDTFQEGSTSLAGTPVVITTDAEANFDKTLTASQANLEIDIAFPYTRIKSFYVLAQGACTLKINSSTDPDVTITLAAGQPLKWRYVDAAANPFSTNVSSIFLTDTSAASNRIQFFLAYEGTP